jgi:hypothetical protein
MLVIEVLGLTTSAKNSLPFLLHPLLFIVFLIDSLGAYSFQDDFVALGSSAKSLLGACEVRFVVDIFSINAVSFHMLV